MREVTVVYIYLFIFVQMAYMHFLVHCATPKTETAARHKIMLNRVILYISYNYLSSIALSLWLYSGYSPHRTFLIAVKPWEFSCYFLSLSLVYTLRLNSQVWMSSRVNLYSHLHAPVIHAALATIKVSIQLQSTRYTGQSSNTIPNIWLLRAKTSNVLCSPPFPRFFFSHFCGSFTLLINTLSFSCPLMSNRKLTSKAYPSHGLQ